MKTIIKKLEELEQFHNCHKKYFDFGCEDIVVSSNEWCACEDIVDFWLQGRWADTHLLSVPDLCSCASGGVHHLVFRDIFNELLFQTVCYFEGGKPQSADGELSMEQRRHPNRRRIAKKLKCVLCSKCYNLLKSIVNSPIF